MTELKLHSFQKFNWRVCFASLFLVKQCAIWQAPVELPCFSHINWAQYVRTVNANMCQENVCIDQLVSCRFHCGTTLMKIILHFFLLIGLSWHLSSAMIGTSSFSWFFSLCVRFIWILSMCQFATTQIAAPDGVVADLVLKLKCKYLELLGHVLDPFRIWTATMKLRSAAIKILTNTKIIGLCNGLFEKINPLINLWWENPHSPHVDI